MQMSASGVDATVFFLPVSCLHSPLLQRAGLSVDCSAPLLMRLSSVASRTAALLLAVAAASAERSTVAALTAVAKGWTASSFWNLLKRQSEQSRAERRDDGLFSEPLRLTSLQRELFDDQSAHL